MRNLNEMFLSKSRIIMEEWNCIFYTTIITFLHLRCEVQHSDFDYSLQMLPNARPGVTIPAECGKTIQQTGQEKIVKSGILSPEGHNKKHQESY